jgi:glycosyltransferase involved in cell wall biosynthesis
LELARTTFPLYSPNREINIGYGVPDSPVHTEEMDRAFHESCPGLHYERPFLLFLSRIHPKKGIDLLIRAYAEVFGDLSKAKRDKPADVTSQLTAPNSQLPEPFAFSQSSISDTPFPINHVPALVIAGPVDSDYAREMIRLAECLLPGLVVSPRLPSVTRLPIPDHPCPINRPAIHFSGMLQGDAKWGALYRCEVFVLPSHQENFGISIAEALSCSKPVLISRQVNIAPEIQSDRAGFVGPGNLEGVASLLRRWKESQPLERSVLVRSAYACFVSRFGVASAAQRLWVALRSGSPNNSITQNLS